MSVKISHVTKSSSHTQKAREAVQALASIQGSDFYRVPSILELFESSQARASELENFDTLCVLGIGGSSLGPKVIAQVLPSERKLEVFENVDPLSFESRLKKLNLETCHWVVISKSGKTLETLAQLTLIVEKYVGLGFSLRDHFTVISDPVENPLTLWAVEHQVARLSIPAKVGGRYSVLTPVGLLPAAFLGHSADEFRLGALDANANTETLIEAVAQTLSSFDRSEWITVFWSYTDLLTHFGGWIQQLWAESLAKTNSARVSTPMPLVGANDQHSTLQQVMEGARDKFIWFIELEEAEKSKILKPLTKPIGLPSFLEGKTLGQILSAERRATQQALQSQGVQSLTLKISDLSPRTLGHLFQFFENTVAGVAQALGIDAFNQPGVELGKRLAYEILEKERS